jgi:hypothetical protein
MKKPMLVLFYAIVFFSKFEKGPGIKWHIQIRIETMLSVS